MAIYTKLVEKKGRKVVVNAEMKNLAGETLADAQYAPLLPPLPLHLALLTDTCDVSILD